MKRLILAVVFLISSLCFAIGNDEFKVIESPNMKENISTILDINSASKEEMLRNGISLTYVNKIIEYRDITGGFENIGELTRINGIGKKTEEKLSKSLKVNFKPKLKSFNINTADTKTLIYFGLDKKEIKSIEEYKKKNGKIKSNLQLMEILSKEKYNKYKDIVKY